jgi:coenzyme F420-0:L-glutamate ligase
VIVKPVKTRIFGEGESLPDFVIKHISRIKEGSIIAVASKIVALSESRTAPLKEKTKHIRASSERTLKTKHVWLTVTDGMFMANAGIDESNARGKLVLLPKDSFNSAHSLRTALRKHYKIKKLGIVITDSRTMPMRAGVVGVALGYAGFQGLRDYRGKPDLFGRKFKYSQSNLADSLASAAVLMSGEGNESQPLVVIEGAPVRFVGKVSKKEASIPLKDDMYFPLLKKLFRKK